MKTAFITALGKSISLASKLTNHGSGSTWPGHIALSLNKNYIQDVLKNAHTQIILIVGTNGKTTTAKILATILGKANKHVFQNSSGANLLNGIASSLLLHSSIFSTTKADYAIFEVDENNLPLVLTQLTPKAIIVLDLFRDQLDRYGELDTIAKKWQEAFKKLSPDTHLILNADDPLIAYLGHDTKATISYFGLDQTTEQNNQLQHAADSLYCPQCSNKLIFQKIFYSHLGTWKCPHCRLQRPIPTLAKSYYPLAGTYNKYNTLAAHLCAKELNVPEEIINSALRTVVPAFGRQEKIHIQGREIQLFLAKNPTGFNETLKTITEIETKEPKETKENFTVIARNGMMKQSKQINIMLVLNDRIPDGRDVSWIWDTDLEEYVDKFSNIFISGDRTYDMALRVQFSLKTPKSLHSLTIPNLKQALKKAIETTPIGETLYILPTYSAMLDVRKILTGRKIL